MRRMIKNNLGNFLMVCLIFLIMAGWIFSGWPQIWHKPSVPPEIQEAKAASEGPNSPSSGSTSADSGTVDWLNSGNVTASDNSRATAILTKNVFSYYLKATGFGFSIPAGNAIDGITVEIERSIAEAASNTRDNSVKIIKGGTITGDEKADTATFWPANSGDAYATYGGSTDTWGVSWTIDDINNSNFGVAVQAINVIPTKPVDETAQIDHIRITVYYTPAAIISVSVSDGVVTYGTLGQNSTKSTHSGDLGDLQTATNDGDVTEDFNIKGQNSGNWTLGATAGSDIYVHQFCTSSCTTPPTNYTALTTGYQTLTTGITPTNNQTFDLYINTPNPSTVYTEQSVNVIIQAVQSL